jgi:NADP-dependent 3-hydroxy acid dehydrogenase YdfG
MIASGAPVRHPAFAPVSLAGKIAVVTGASSGIGRAIALALALEKATVVAVGRNVDELEKTTAAAARLTTTAVPCRTDLKSRAAIRRLVEEVSIRFERIDVLVHCAGVIVEKRMKDASIRELDWQYLSNVRAPYELTRAALPMLKANGGQVVFINSSTGLSAKRAEVGQFAATQHALKAIADSLREEVNAEGVRVLTVHPGRTATPRQEHIHQREGKPYRPEVLMQPEDVATIVISALRLPMTAEVTDISIRPMIKN